jgi:hypothetical protein
MRDAKVCRHQQIFVDFLLLCDCFYATKRKVFRHCPWSLML